MPEMINACYSALLYCPVIFGALLLVIGPCSDVGALMAPWPVSNPPSAVPAEAVRLLTLPHYHSHLQNGVVAILNHWVGRLKKEKV